MVLRGRTAACLKALWGGVTVVAVGALVAACGHSGAPVSSSTTLPPAPSTTTTTAAAAPTTTTTTAGGQVAGARCRSSVLTASAAGRNGGAGTLEVTIALTSDATVPCTLEGYPGLQMRDSAGSALPTDVVRKGTYSFTAMAPTLVTLAPGGSARFNIGYSDVPVGTETSCPSSATIDVTPPNAYNSVSVTESVAPCGNGTLVVSPVYAPPA